MKSEFDIRSIAGSLRDMIVNYIYATPHDNKDALAMTRQLLAELAIELLMGPDPHTKRRPHHETVECLAAGLLARIDVSNARPSAYADEPWRHQGGVCHAEHAIAHVKAAQESLTCIGPDWMSDLGQPEIAHAAFRCDMLLWSHNNAGEK